MSSCAQRCSCSYFLSPALDSFSSFRSLPALLEPENPFAGPHPGRPGCWTLRRRRRRRCFAALEAFNDDTAQRTSQVFPPIGGADDGVNGGLSLCVRTYARTRACQGIVAGAAGGRSRTGVEFVASIGERSRNIGEETENLV